MLQDNTARADHRHNAHLAHAAVVSMHALCCGVPVLALMLAALSGATTGITLFAQAAGRVHNLLHAHEFWILGLSAILVTGGGLMELAAHRAGRSHGIPWLYVMSVACFGLNLAIILAHRGV